MKDAEGLLLWEELLPPTSWRQKTLLWNVKL